MRIKNIVLIQAAVLAVMVPVISNVQTVKAEDYCIELTIEETEIPINYIENNRIVHVPISVNNNPGIESLSFIVKRDERINKTISACEYADFPFNGGLGTIYARDSLYAGVLAGYSHDAYYDYNGRYCYIEMTLPENYQIGDYYSLSFCNDDFPGLEHIQFEKDGNVYGKEYFRFNDGGIKIIDEVNYGVTPDSQVESSTEASVNNQEEPQNQQGNSDDNSKEVHNQNNNNYSNNDNIRSDSNSSESSKTKDPVSTAVTSAAAMVTTSVSSVSRTSASKKVSKTTVTKISTEKNTIKQPVTEPDQTDIVATVSQTKKNRNYTKIVVAAVSALILLAIAIVTVIVKKKKK